MNLEQLWSAWHSLQPSQRRKILLLAAVTVAATVGLVMLGQRADYRVLYSDLNPEEAGAIVEYLRANGYRHRLGAAGRTIEVDGPRVYALRLALAQEGLPRTSSGVGFELFDRSGLPGSEFSNQVSYQRALQGELERTIGALDKIEAARVLLVLPRYDLYSGQQPASASVMVDTRGAVLSPREVQGIVYLTAGAVQGLSPESVTLVNEHGTILSDPGLGGGHSTMTQMQARQDYERGLQQALQSMLDRSLGEHRTIVQVQADLDFDQQRVTSRSVRPTPGPGSVLEEQITEEEYVGSAPWSGGPAGLTANLDPPASAGRMSGGGSGTYASRQESRTYDYTREERELIKSLGEVRRLTVAVALDIEAPVGAELQVTELITAAAGLNTQRGDLVTVQRLELAAKQQAEEARTEAEQVEQARQRAGRLSQLVRYGTLLLLGLIIGASTLLAARQVQRQAASLGSSSALSGEAVAGAGGLPGPVEAPAGTPYAAGAESPMVDLQVGAPENDLDTLARGNPRLFAHQIAQLLGQAAEEPSGPTAPAAD